MRWIIIVVAVTALTGWYEFRRQPGRLQAASHTNGRILYFVDPMHPAYRSDRPGTAPDCGMKLEPVYADAGVTAGAPRERAARPAGAITIAAGTQLLAGISVVPAERRGMLTFIRAAGRVVAEDTRMYKLNAGVDGFIRETRNDAPGMPVSKDQVLATYYGPEFLAAVSGFIAATERVPGTVGSDGARFTPSFPGALAKEGVKSIHGYADRLRNLGMSDPQINRIAANHQLPESVDVVSPIDGFILARNISPGQHFDHGMEFYRIVDLSRVWVLAEVDQDQVRRISPGARAQLRIKGAARPWPAQVTGSLPQSEVDGGTVKLRLEADNPGSLLRPEMVVDVELPVRLPAAITVPADAIVDSGTRTLVYVETEEGTFEPREVITGWRSGDRVEIAAGLGENERVVASATFLVDSESRLKAAASAPGPTLAGAGPTQSGQHQ